MKFLNELLDLLTEKVFDEAHYTWFDVTDTFPLTRRGKTERINKGDVLGLRRATSADGKYRVVVKSRGPSIIWSVDEAGYTLIKKNTKPLRGSLN